ncbi:copper amine oxidase N-terminal domain-containing protein [Paenibacillus agaridevorans]|uniref:copper amine oxidase N-terminal domain-containing protein n=1 Tax=Paenibacillus agaridevorans TaxID=171404 RepID=UPI001BE47DF8|nr:copper amine oxidase N-terminal domain-containing protein [Paenibacillus agaridevorans]
MKNKLLKRAAVAALALAVMIVTGCQAIAGLDLNAVLKNAVKVTSGESKSSLELQLRLNEEALAEYDEDEADLYRLLSHVKLTIDHAAVEDESNMSVEGKVTLSDLNIPFKLRLSETAMVLELEGVTTPIVFDLSDEAIGSMFDIETDSGNGISAEQERTLTEVGRQIMDFVSGYAIDNLPNPSNLTAAPVVETVGGSPVSMMKLQFTMDGPSIWEWAKTYVNALIDDREGLTNAVGSILKLLEENPVFWEALGEINPFEGDVLDAPTSDEMAEEAVEEIITLLESAREEMEWTESEDEEFLNELLNESLVLKADVYVDAKLDIRKQAWELNYELGEALNDEYYESVVTGFTVKSSSEQWNVNGTVTAADPVVTEDSLSILDMELMEGYEALHYVDEDSDLYELLKNRLHITRQTYNAFADDYYNPPIIMPGYVTVVAVRDVAEAFGATVSYNSLTRQVSVYDELTDTRIIMQIGSDKVKVNGVDEVWPYPVMTIDSVTYVPARKLAEALGADIEWNTVYEDWKELTIARE